MNYLINRNQEMTTTIDYNLLRDEWVAACNKSDDSIKITNGVNLKDCVKQFQLDLGSYTSLVYNRTDENAIMELEPEIELVTTDQQHRLWDFLNIHTSSIKSTRSIQNSIRLLIRDNISKKYIGILQLSCDNYGCAPREKYIGWDNKHRSNNINNVASIRCCVSMQPAGFNYNIGKLLTAIAFSSEVQDMYTEQFGNVLGAITTVGINCPTTQYSQLPFIKHVGDITELSIVKILPKLYNKTLAFMKQNGVEPTLDVQTNERGVILSMMQYLELSPSLLDSRKRKSIYVGFTGELSREFLQGKIEVNKFVRREWPLADVIQWWKCKWANKRYAHLVSTNRVKTEIQLVDYKTISNYSEIAPGERERSYISNINVNTIINKDFKVSTELDPSYLAGMIDGDGTISIKNKRAYVSIGQCDIRVLLAIQDKFGGDIRITKNKLSTQRDMYIYYIANAEAIPLLRLLSDHIILKQKRCNAALRWLESNTLDKEAYDVITILQKDYTPDSNEVWNRVNNAYIAGFFDAEGCISALRKPGLSFSLSITQTSSNEILQKIRSVVGIGKATDKSIRFNIYNKKDITAFANIVLPYIIVKREQVDAMITLMNDSSISQTDKDKLVDFIKTCKHTNYTIDKLTLIMRNITGHSVASNKVLKEKEDIYQAKMKVFSKEQSDRKS